MYCWLAASERRFSNFVKLKFSWFTLFLIFGHFWSTCQCGGRKSISQFFPNGHFFCLILFSILSILVNFSTCGGCKSHSHFFQIGFVSVSSSWFINLIIFIFFDLRQPQVDFPILFKMAKLLFYLFLLVSIFVVFFRLVATASPANAHVRRSYNGTTTELSQVGVCSTCGRRKSGKKK